MSLHPRKGIGKVRGVFSRAKARLDKKKKKAVELRTKVLESKLAGTLIKVQKSAKAAGGGLSRSSGAVLQILRERGHTEEKKETPPTGDTAPDIPKPKRLAKHEPQHLTVHLSKKPDIESKGVESKASKLARQAFLLHFQSAERRELGLTFEEIRFRNRLIVMWWEWQQKSRPLSYGDQLLFDVLLRLMIEYYGLYTSTPTEELT